MIPTSFKLLTILKMKKKHKIKHSYYNLIFTFIMNLGMALAMSLSMHIINVGVRDFSTIWVRNFSYSILIGFPIALVLVNAINRFMKMIFTQDQ